MQAPPAAAATVAAGPAFAVPLPVFVEDDLTGRRYRGTLQLPRLAPSAPVPPSAAVLARLDPLLRAHGDALAAQAEGLDPERLSRTFAALMAELPGAAGMCVDGVELTPDTLRDVINGGGEEEGEEDFDYSEEEELNYRAQLVELPEGLRALAGELRTLRVESTRLAEVPAWVQELTRLQGLTLVGRCGDLFGGVPGQRVSNAELAALPAELFQLGALKTLYLSNLSELQEMPAASGVTSLQMLAIAYCTKLTALPAGLFQLGALKNLVLSDLPELQEIPDASGLTTLVLVRIAYCKKLTALPAGLCQLEALKDLTLLGLDALQKMPDTLGRMTALERLELSECGKLKALPPSIMHLSQLQHLQIDGCPLQDMPCMEALKALRTLELFVSHDSRAFKALSRSLPCLQQLHSLHLRRYTPTRIKALRAEDVLAIGRALKAWPLPLLRDVQEDHARLSTCWQALGLPAAAADWSNATTLEFFRVQQHKMAAFASGMHARLGAASGVSRLDEQTLVMIADEVLGGWGLLREWQQERAGEGGCARRRGRRI